MLKSLHIRNYALIDDLKIDFEKGLTCLTGEAGTGKSILLGAIGQVLGDRADSKSCFNTDSKSIIEVCFSIDDDLYSFFEENNIDFDRNCIIRREISSQGKSRSFINDTPVSLQVLKTLGAKLLDIHSQFQKFSLSNNDSQLSFVDDFIDDENLLTDYSSCYQNYQRVCHDIEMIEKQYNRQITDKDYNNFLFKELDDAKLVVDEYEAIENELNKLNHCELVKEKLSLSLSILSENEDFNVVSGCYDAKNWISDISDYLDNGNELSERINSSYVEVKDIADEISRCLDSVDFNPQRQQECIDRIDLLNRLMRKHNVKTVAELIDLKNKLSENINDVDALYNEIIRLKKDKEQIYGKLDGDASILSKRRKNAASQLSSAISSELDSLGITSNKFIINIDLLNEFTPSGKDYVEFLFSANVGVAPEPLFQVASGGELSRIMLALKSVIAVKHSIPTIIFDEIDSGISGVTASAVAEKLKKLSQYIQIIAITHLPQIASKADNQFLVYKENSADRTFSRVKHLSFEERVNAIASMISGDRINQDALNNARYLLTN